MLLTPAIGVVKPRREGQVASLAPTSGSHSDGLCGVWDFSSLVFSPSPSAQKFHYSNKAAHLPHSPQGEELLTIGGATVDSGFVCLHLINADS